MTGSKMVFEPSAARGLSEGDASGDPLGNRVLLLTRDAGFAEVAVVDFTYETGPTLFGSREQLLQEWRTNLGIETPPPVLQSSAPSLREGE
jgi:hypothetical protein